MSFPMTSCPQEQELTWIWTDHFSALSSLVLICKRCKSNTWCRGKGNEEWYFPTGSLVQVIVTSKSKHKHSEGGWEVFSGRRKFWVTSMHSEISILEFDSNGAAYRQVRRKGYQSRNTGTRGRVNLCTRISTTNTPGVFWSGFKALSSLKERNEQVPDDAHFTHQIISSQSDSGATSYSGNGLLCFLEAEWNHFHSWLTVIL